MSVTLSLKCFFRPQHEYQLRFHTKKEVSTLNITCAYRNLWATIFSDTMIIIIDSGRFLSSWTRKNVKNHIPNLES